MRVPTALLLVLVAILTVVLGAGAVADAVAAEESPNEWTDEEKQVIRIELTDDGHAEWTIETHVYLEDEDDVDRFEAWAEEVRTGQRSLDGYDRRTFERFVRYAEQRTDEDMRIEDSGWDEPRIASTNESTAVDDPNGTVGVLSYSVTWTNFAESSDNRLYLQNTFLTEDGHAWWGMITEDQRFVIEAPPNHEFATTPHGIDDGKLVWEGPHEFDEGDFDIVLRYRGIPLIGSWHPVFGATLVAGLAAVLWYVLRYRNDADRIDPQPRETPPTDTNTAVDDEVAAGSTDDTTALEYEEDEEVDVELLSDEERVHHLLHRNGGRMKQATIVKETGWSNAKVSQLLSQMHDDDEIRKLRIGRENLITLPEVDPTEIE